MDDIDLITPCVYWINGDSADVGRGQVFTRKAGDYFYAYYEFGGAEWSSGACPTLREAVETAIRKSGLEAVDMESLP